MVGCFISSLDGSAIQRIVSGDIIDSLLIVNKGYVVWFLLCCKNNKVWVVLKVNWGRCLWLCKGDLCQT
jgi:hypothetical protein